MFEIHYALIMVDGGRIISKKILRAHININSHVLSCDTHPAQTLTDHYSIIICRIFITGGPVLSPFTLWHRFETRLRRNPTSFITSYRPHLPHVQRVETRAQPPTKREKEMPRHFEIVYSVEGGLDVCSMELETSRQIFDFP